MKTVHFGILIGLTILLSFPLQTFAQAEESKCNDEQFGFFEVPLPGFEGRSICNVVSDGTPFITIFSFFAKFLMGLIIAIALIVVVLAGYMYMTAGGDGSKVEASKAMIRAALLGIILALSAFLILNSISPQFASDLQEPSFGHPNDLPPGEEL